MNNNRHHTENDLETMIEESMLFDIHNPIGERDVEMSTNFIEDSGVDGFMSSSAFANNTDDDSFFRFRRNLSSSNDLYSSNINMTTMTTSKSMSLLSNESSRVRDIFYCSNYFDLNDILSQTIRLSVKFQRTIPKLGYLDPSQQHHQEESSDDNMTSHDIAIGTKLELPLWMVKELNGDRAVMVKLPKGYNLIYREILEADANCVNLHKLGPNYYLSGRHLTGMNLAESEDVAISMLRTFKQRFRRLVNFALSGNTCGRSGVGTNGSLSNMDDNGDSLHESTCSSISKLDSMIKTDQHERFLRETGSKGPTSITDETLNDMNQFVSRLDNWERELLNVGRRLASQMKLWENRELIRIRANEMVINLRKRKILLKTTIATE